MLWTLLSLQRRDGSRLVILDISQEVWTETYLYPMMAWPCQLLQSLLELQATSFLLPLGWSGCALPEKAPPGGRALPPKYFRL